MSAPSLVFTADINVFDEEALRRAACAQASKEGLTEEGWKSLRQGFASDPIMLLDPGAIPRRGLRDSALGVCCKRGRRMKQPSPPTNIEFVTDLMQFSAHGALIQAFVLEALRYYAQKVAAADPEVLDTGMVSGHAWHGCALEIQRKLKQRFDS